MIVDPIVEKTKNWIQKIVVAHNFCPFASKPLLENSIRFNVCNGKSLHILKVLEDEIDFLENNNEISTTLIILDKIYERFSDYLDLLDAAHSLILELKLEGIYQIASFHPQYQFAQTAYDDPANFTNRAPYPILHLLREDEMAKALSKHPNPESIPQKNIVKSRELGSDYFIQLLKNL